MSRQEAIQQFRQALKAGQKCYRECVHRGRYPYPQVLEERLRDCAVAGRVDLGVLDIPIAQIIGTNTAGRQAAFAANFMPLLDLGTEFAGKWVALCEAHLGDTGITDPIRCFEYMGSFYVQEGNKRVSVLKALTRRPSVPMSRASCRSIPTTRQCGSIMNFCTFMGSAACIRCISTVSATIPSCRPRWASMPTMSGQSGKNARF